MAKQAQRANSAIVPTKLVVARCVRCDEAVWMFQELGLTWLLDPRPVTDIRQKPLYRINPANGKAMSLFGEPQGKVFGHHRHQAGARASKVVDEGKLIRRARVEEGPGF